MGCRRHRDEGFTLIELVVIVGLIGVLFAMAVPSVSGFLRSSRVTGASNTLVADLRYGRSLASAQRKSYQISFTGSSYTLSAVSPVQTITRRTLPSGVTCSASGTATFFSYGLTTPVTVRMVAGHDTSAVILGVNGSVTRD
jgi:Tfp pilus assembly protein PilE